MKCTPRLIPSAANGAIGALKPRAAFTLIEVLALLTVTTLLFCLMLPAFARTATQSQIAQCEANLKQLALAVQLYGKEFHDKLPVLAGGNWPWDVPASVIPALDQYGAHRTQMYDPGFPYQNADQMWSGSGSYAATGYAWSFSGPGPGSYGYATFQDDCNTSLATQVKTLVPVGAQGSDPQLTATIPAMNGAIKINPSRRVLVANVIMSNPNQYDPTQATTYNWTKHTESGNMAWQTPYGQWRGSSTSHVTTVPNQNGFLMPLGGNEAMLDGRVKWYPFNGMIVHATQDGILGAIQGYCFWWQTDPAKL